MPDSTRPASSRPASSKTDTPPEELLAQAGRLVPLPAVATLLDVTIVRVHQLLKDGQLVAVTDDDGRRAMPIGFVAGGQVLKALPSVIQLLRDARYGDDEIVDWLNREDDSLPGTPLQALMTNRGTEIKRRAQASGF